MKRIVKKGSNGVYFHQCSVCETYFTYEIRDTFVRFWDFLDGIDDRSVKCTECGNKDYADFEEYKGEIK